MDLIPEGKYIGKIINYGIRRTRAGDPQAVIAFRFDVDGVLRQLTWYGSFKEKALEFTVDQLFICGLQEDNLSIIAEGPASLALNTKREYMLTVRHETNEGGELKARLAWINIPGGLAFKELMEKQEAEKHLSHLKAYVSNRRTSITQGYSSPDMN